jgi:hypothetical protein
MVQVNAVAMKGPNTGSFDASGDAVELPYPPVIYLRKVTKLDCSFMKLTSCHGGKLTYYIFGWIILVVVSVLIGIFFAM